MLFDTESKVVESYVLLISAGEKTIDDVPNIQNLREVVLNVLEQAN